MTYPSRTAHALCLAILLAATPAGVQAHDGPPFPIVSDEVAGPYSISVWTDPDATDDGTPGGQFWVMLEMADGSDVPAGTRASVTIAPLDRQGPPRSGAAAPVEGDASRQFIALLMDHEGPFSVRSAVEGPAGAATVEATVEATYDLRPPPFTLALYLLPFVMVGGLWLKLLLRRRAARRGATEEASHRGTEGTETERI